MSIPAILETALVLLMFAGFCTYFGVYVLYYMTIGCIPETKPPTVPRCAVALAFTLAGGGVLARVVILLQRGRDVLGAAYLSLALILVAGAVPRALVGEGHCGALP